MGRFKKLIIIMLHVRGGCLSFVYIFKGLGERMCGCEGGDAGGSEEEGRDMGT